MPGPVPKMVLAAALLALSACQKPDVGQPCDITWGDTSPAPTPTTVSADYFESGNTTCENLVCIVSPVTEGRYSTQGYCSKPCVSNQDCFESDTGLVCRQVVLDAVFIQQLDPAVQDKYLGEIRFSSYCAVPR